MYSRLSAFMEKTPPRVERPYPGLEDKASTKALVKLPVAG
jgi:hypothetical protein